MDYGRNEGAPVGTAPQADAVEHLTNALAEGRHWFTALLEAMALWSVPQETYRGREYRYFIGGEAFDWLLLAERLCDAAGGLIPEREAEELLFTGRLPARFDEAQFKDLLGIDKYRGYLNYFYGVTVEEALQLACEGEVHKRHLSGGNQYQSDFTEEAYLRIYRESRSELLKRFREERGYGSRRSTSLAEIKEFTYWLFEYRLKTSDKAKIASDTRKGLDQLRQMRRSTEAASRGPWPDETDSGEYWAVRKVPRRR